MAVWAEKECELCSGTGRVLIPHCRRSFHSSKKEQCGKCHGSGKITFLPGTPEKRALSLDGLIVRQS